MSGEYTAEQYRDLVEAYRVAEAETEAMVWPDRPDAANRIIAFDTRPAQD